MAIPDFTADGILPPGDHPATFGELRRSHLVQGPRLCPLRWDERWRSFLLDQLEVLVRQLWAVGIERVFIGGSFVERVDHPNDIDGYFDCPSSELPAVLERLQERSDDGVWQFTGMFALPDPIHPDKLIWPMQKLYRVHLEPSAPDLSRGELRELLGTRLPLAPRLRRPNPLKRPELFERAPVKGVVALRWDPESRS